MTTTTDADAQPPPEARLLPDSPTDGITSLSYLPTTTTTSSNAASSSSSSKLLLACTSWDGSVRVYDTQTPTLQLQHAMEAGPLLSLAVTDDSVITGGMDGSIQRLQLESKTPQLIGRHHNDDDASSSNNKKAAACSCLAVLPSLNLVASAGWDQKFHLWDMRQSSQSKAVATIDLPGKAFDMDVDLHHNRLVVATSGRHNCFMDVVQQRNDHAAAAAEVVLDRESSLKFQTRCIRFFPDGHGIAAGSVEARVAVEYLDELTGDSGSGKAKKKKKKYAFKCHRVGDRVYPVNAIEFHPRYGNTFATGGCDGTVVLWDALNKKKLTSLPQFPTSISALAFSPDGNELAIASSYTFEEGEREHNPRDEIYVRQMLDSECMPKNI